MNRKMKILKIVMICSTVFFLLLGIFSYPILQNTTHTTECPNSHETFCQCALCKYKFHDTFMRRGRFSSIPCNCELCQKIGNLKTYDHDDECKYVEHVACHDENCTNSECECYCQTCEICKSNAKQTTVIAIISGVMVGISLMGLVLLYVCKIIN